MLKKKGKKEDKCLQGGTWFWYFIIYYILCDTESCFVNLLWGLCENSFLFFVG